MDLLGPYRKSLSKRQEAPVEAIPVVNKSSAHNHARASELAIVEACVNLIVSCFKQATVQPENLVYALKKDLLASMIRRMLTAGESLAVMEMQDGGLALHQAVSWNVSGQSSNPNKWHYQSQISVPSGGRTVNTRGSGVIHFRYACLPENNYIGYSPLYFMRGTAGLLYELDRRFDEEAQTSTGQILSMTMESGEVDSGLNFQGHYQALQKMKGGLFVERQNRERGSQMNFAGRTRLGPEFSPSQVSLRDRLEANIASAFGVPIELLIADGEGTATREAFRRFVLTTIQPLASILSEELSLKFERPIAFRFDSLRSSDLQGIARAIKALVDSGKSIDEAMKLAGLV